jgi:hypothetical protein
MWRDYVDTNSFLGIRQACPSGEPNAVLRLMSPAVDLVSAVRRWWHRERQTNSAEASVRQAFALVWEFLRESLPARRRQRYGDAEYDWEYRVDTTSATVGWGTRLRGLLHSPYQPVEPELFRTIMNSLEIDFPKFTFIDIGSGKGRALLLASEYPFDRILGVELLPELDQIARENIRKFSASRRCSNIEAVLGDATEFNFLDRPLVVFLFHPLPEPDFRRLMTNLVGSSRQFPRPIYLIYTHPLFENLVAASGIFEKLDGNEHYSLFRTLPAR